MHWKRVIQDLVGNGNQIKGMHCAFKVSNDIQDTNVVFYLAALVDAFKPRKLKWVDASVERCEKGSEGIDLIVEMARKFKRRSNQAEQ